MRLIVVGLLLGFACTAWADRIFSGVYWPGWQIRTWEDMVSPSYPLSNMLDGRLDTAWVYNKALHEHQEGKPQPFNHGVEKEIWIRNTSGSPVMLDGIGITNGYVKDSPTYWRNNRIRKISLTLGDEQVVTHSFLLQDTRTLQRFSFPRVSARWITLRVEGVDPGKDDDLCISELQFLNNDRPLGWELTPFVFTNHSSQSCCGGTDFALRTQGGLPLTGPDGKQLTVAAFACQPGTSIALLGSKTALYLFDMQRGAYVYRRTLAGELASLGWLNADTAAISLFPDARHDWKRITWFHLQVDGSPRWKAIKQPVDADRFLPGWVGPWYSV